MKTIERKNLTPDQAAAHEFLAELRTRISTQTLPYQHGVESRALESLWEVFSQAREVIRKYPGCMHFADLVVPVLNGKLRPVTAKWHRAYVEGRLNSRDGANEFREDLAAVQFQLREFLPVLREMAYGSGGADIMVPPVISDEVLKEHFKDLPYGILDDYFYFKGDGDGRPRPAASPKLGSVADLNDKEKAEVQKRRGFAGSNAKEGKNATGLSFSGGGIRSASFCLGVAQVLAQRNLLKDIDFLSTVSGGGYVGSFISRRLGKLRSTVQDIGNPDGPDKEAISYLRHHAQYLMGFNLWDRWKMVTCTLGGMILNWTSPMMFIALVSIFAVLLHKIWSPPWPYLEAGGGILVLVVLVLYGMLVWSSKDWAAFGGRLLGWSVGLWALINLGWLIAVGYCFVGHWAGSMRFWTIAGIVGVLSTSGPTIIRFMPVLSAPGVRKAVLKILLASAGLAIPLLSVLLFYGFFYLGNLPSHHFVWPKSYPGWVHHINGLVLLFLITAALAVVALRVLNVNLTAPHKLYRDRLDKTFVQFDEKATADYPLTDLNPEKTTAPYHLINTAVNLPSSDSPLLRERKCDFFLFSKHWSGSPLTGYYETSEWKANQSTPDLATVMAISGAAVSSYMGLVSMPSLTALLTFLNVRLGFWIASPNPRSKMPLGKSPGFFCLIREILGKDMSEKSDWLNLSDGGHIENMGAYELLRRRCKFVICVDGEADPEFTYIGLITMVRHAQIDLGIHIEIDMSSIRPDPKTGYSATHSLLCRIHYPPAGNEPAAIGLFLYLKLSVTGNESELIKRYRMVHPEFPHQSTLDQFFTQEQFEAYRQLGVHVTEGLFASALTNGATEPTTVANWFESLASNLLVPERS